MTANTGHLLHTLRSQGRFCGASGSRMYDDLFELVASDVEAGGIFASILSGHEDDPSREAVPLRLLGGLHRLVLGDRAPALRQWYPSTGGTWDAGSAWPAIKAVAFDHADSLRAALGHPPQTNEVGRSAALIGALLRINHEIGFPVRLFEIGSSAGLNLRADKYRYRYGSGQWGPSDSPVLIDHAWQGQLPPTGSVQIVERRGYDIAPVDVTVADGEITASSYVWPDQVARLQRLRGAIAIARKVPAQLVRLSAADAVAGLTLAEGALTVLWHSVIWQYLSENERTAVRAHVSSLGARADARSPFAHLTMEPARDGPGAALKFLVRARRWPRGELVVLGECHAHGPPVNWQ
ncbi:DUF2332 domain-containing protein [Mycobacterium montefiorense]|uniref:DUF2332 domain-containing protein n=1 Tax=Mycobacterium montefiorense TaxID=154654 RepID=A0AA37PSG2_9MYCO|nr:DUF2332 family protein [Mycobacterium montefiorense]GBG40768.1 hypothetical protein MmonteBS_51400 [Mycobacterium montefiorense]GKU33249.1 hypothetical protein NJB14191_05960 [Mycobacterium montefiorense]GKU41824.1 hypothetical protein NJB14192_38070 [Mycobacterium montefiorense]GKU44953.1 hypothetical protein NJB14194_15770 [Mycobacterium montefiorense]GKU52247.1 hypothetical protein NJB14195_34910 [Mycobacterium montefiorense]